MAPTLSPSFWTRSETGDAGSAQAPGVGTGSDAGASGDSSANSVELSTGGLIAIIVVVIAVVILGGKPAGPCGTTFILELTHSAQLQLQLSSGLPSSESGPSKRQFDVQQRR
jgi:hypothetical protein